MANTIIKLKKSSTAAATPSALEFGELAINYADGILFYKNATSHIVSFSSSGGSSFGTVIANGVTLVSDTTNDILEIKAGDNISITADPLGDNLTISATATAAASVDIGDTAPGSPTAGQLWWNSANGSMFIYYNDGTSSQWVQTNYPFTTSAYLANNNITIKGNVYAEGTLSDTYGNLRALPLQDKTSAYILLKTDVGRVVSITTGGVTVPNTVFSAGDGVTIYNNSSASQTITSTSDITMYLAGTATTGNRTLAQRGLATVYCVAANNFVISGSGLT
jgi:hypothetical protein